LGAKKIRLRPCIKKRKGEKWNKVIYLKMEIYSLLSLWRYVGIWN